MFDDNALLEENVIVNEQEIRFKTKLDGISHPSEFYCLQCHKPVISEVVYNYSKATYLWCFVLCLVTLIGGFIPFCMQKCQTKTHFCPNCQKQAGFTEGECC